jgi:hypothetical protein
MALPWDVYATPIEARKLARLAVERGRVVLQPAFFRQLGASYGAIADAACPLRGHPAPQADCSCGFYAVAPEGDLWRLGADEPDLALLRVELAGRIIEHDHGYRASHQRAFEVRVHGACVRCGSRAEVLHRRRFGALVPACRKCARRAMTLDEVSESLEVPVRFNADDAVPAPRRRRLEFVGLQMLAPVLLLIAAAIVATVWRTAAPLAFGQLGVVAWLLTCPAAVTRLGNRLGIARVEAVRLQHRWSPVIAAVAIGCDVVLTIAVVALWDTIAA